MKGEYSYLEEVGEQPSALNLSFMKDKKELQHQWAELAQRYTFDQDISQQELAVLQETQMAEALTIQVTFLEEQLQGIEPNLKAISLYKEKHSHLQDKRQH